jgi:hypothetical protein
LKGLILQLYFLSFPAEFAGLQIHLEDAETENRGGVG